MQDVLFYQFDGLEQPVQLSGCSHLTKHFPILFPEQDYQRVDAGQNLQADAPLIHITFKDDSYSLTTAGMEETNLYKDKVDVLCDLIAQLALARSHHDLEALYLHAAGVVMNGKLVVFPSQFRAGKSFLTACLVAQGYPYLGDDIVPMTLDTCQACSPGFAPRLRIPLPTTTDKESKDFIDKHIALAGKRYAYLALEDKIRIKKNNRVDIGAFVLLEREEGTSARLEELPVAEVFKQLVKQNFAREVDGARILATLTQAVSSAQCFKLHYDRADEAITLLSEHFSNWPIETDEINIELSSASDRAEKSKSHSEESFTQNTQAQKIRIEAENFLSSPDGRAIYHLNPIASGIWELLAEPVTKEEIISILATAFPLVEHSVIENDVTVILQRFEKKQLICH